MSALELALLALATLAGLALRSWHLGQVGLTHFDEGVYAFTGLGVADPSQPARFFPDQQKFSPPAYFTLVALTNWLGVSPDRSPFVVNVALGTLTIPVLWALTRRWFGPIAAVVAAWLLALSEFHVAMSRTALTDVTFSLTFLLALGAVLSALDKGTWRAAVLGGMAVGLAWNTKYHGWFALVVGAMVIAGRWRLQGAGSAWMWRATKTWLMMAVVALVCYIPWTLYIQSQPGSSAGWAAYFATMLRLDWFGNLWQQIQQQGYLEGPWSRASVPLAVAAGQLVAGRSGRTLSPWMLLSSGIASLLVGSAGSAFALAVWALVSGWRRGMRGGEWILAGVLVLWLVMAPVYHPYFRLILPFTLATFLLAGAAIDDRAVPTVAQSRSRSLAAGGAMLAAVVGYVALLRSDPSDPWRVTLALPGAAAAIDARIPAGAPVSVMGEPALAFYLHRRGHPSWERTTMDQLDRLPEPRYVVTGVYLRRAPVLRASFDARRDRFESVGRFPVGVPSDLRLLDDFRPDSARQWIAAPDTTYDLLLFRYTPPGARGRAP